MSYDYLFPPYGPNFKGTRAEFERRCARKEEEMGRELTKAEVVILTQKETGKKMKTCEELQADAPVSWKDKDNSTVRIFASGATRDNDENKPDYEGFLSPLVITRFGKYMTKHRVQSDGKLRDSDNWQRGIPLTQYLKSLWRHLVALWSMHRDPDPSVPPLDALEDTEDALCAIIFNAAGYLHEHLKATECAIRNEATSAIVYDSEGKVIDNQDAGGPGDCF